MESLRLYPVAGGSVDWARLQKALQKGAAMAVAACLVASLNSSWTLASVSGVTAALWAAAYFWCGRACR